MVFYLASTSTHRGTGPPAGAVRTMYVLRTIITLQSLLLISEVMLPTRTIHRQYLQLCQTNHGNQPGIYWYNGC